MKINSYSRKLAFLIMLLSLFFSCSHYNEKASLSNIPRVPSSTDYSEARINNVRLRIKNLGYPIPDRTIERLFEIKKELTPKSVEEPSVIVETKREFKCTTQKVKIHYKINNEVEYFEALIKKPSTLFSKIWFSKDKYPLVVIQPTLAGPTILEERIAHDLCRYGFATIVPVETILDLPKDLPNFKAYDDNMRIEMIRAQRMIDYATSRRDIDKESVGVIGFSRGAIAGSLLIGLDERISYAYLGAGGVGLGEIIANSQTEKGLKDNKRHMEASNLTGDEFKKALIENIEYDSLLFLDQFNSERLKIMIISNDESVPDKNQELLRKAFNYPKTTYLDKGHVGSILRLVFLYKKDYIDFFLEQANNKSE